MFNIKFKRVYIVVKSLKSILMLFVMINFTSYVNGADRRDFLPSPTPESSFSHKDINNPYLVPECLVAPATKISAQVRISRTIGGCLAPEPIRPFSPCGHGSNNPFDDFFSPKSPIKVGGK